MRDWARWLLLMVPLAVGLAGCFPRVERLPTPTSISLASDQATATPLPNVTPQPRLLERRLIELVWPERIREKDSDLIVLTIAMDEQDQATVTAQAPGDSPGEPVDIPNIYDTHNIVAVARLDMAGVEAYREDIREPLRPGKPVTFPWSIRASEAGTYRGIVWLRLELVPKAGGPVEEMLLLARPIEVQVVTVFGLSGNAARILGAAGLVLGTVLGYPVVQNWVEKRLKRRKGSGPPSKPNQPGSREVRQPDSDSF